MLGIKSFLNYKIVDNLENLELIRIINYSIKNGWIKFDAAKNKYKVEIKDRITGISTEYLIGQNYIEILEYLNKNENRKIVLNYLNENNNLPEEKGSLKLIKLCVYDEIK